MFGESESGRTVKSVETAIEIVDFVREADGARQREIAEHLSLADSTVHKHLNTLTENALLVEIDGEYRTGLEFLHFGGQAQNRTRVNRLARPIVADLAEKSGEQSQYIIEEYGRGYHVHTAPSEHGTQIDTRIGKRIYLHANSSGKAIMAHLPDDRVDAILDRWGLPAVTEHTITDRDRLEEELERTRERGYAINDEEHVIGWGGVAAPVFDPDGSVLGALAIGGPTKRYEGDLDDSQLPDMVLEAANQLELRIEFD